MVSIKAAFDAQNLIRTQPKKVATIIQQQMKEYKIESNKDWKEGYTHLLSKPTLAPLKWSAPLALAAVDHCADIGPKNRMSHTGTDGSKFWERVERHSKELHPGAENIGVGFESGMDFLL